MTRAEILQRFPRASEQFVKQNMETENIVKHPSSKTATEAGAKPRRGKQMNQTEARFLHWIKGQRVGRFEFEAVKLRIGENCYYAPDFMLTNLIDEKTTFYEVKGAHIWDDSKVKFKAAKERYPHWSFEMWQWKNGEWKQLF